MSSRCRPAEPGHGLRLVDRDAFTEFVHQSEAVLRLRIPSLGDRTQFSGGGDVVALLERLQSFRKTGHAGSRKDHGDRKYQQRRTSKATAHIESPYRGLRN